MRYILLLILLVFCVSNAQFHGMYKWANWAHAEQDRIPKLNGALKLLVDPNRQLFGSNTCDWALGANIVENGDFHDFTMDNDSSVKGHWIFDAYYNQQEGGGGYIGEDWSQGGAIYVEKFLTNYDWSSGSLSPGWSSNVYSYEILSEYDGRNNVLHFNSSSSQAVYSSVSDMSIPAVKGDLIRFKVYFKHESGYKFRFGIVERQNSSYIKATYYNPSSTGVWDTLDIVYRVTDANTNHLTVYLRHQGDSGTSYVEKVESVSILL